MNNDKETALLTVTPSPHVKRHSNVRSIMIEVALALTPAALWGIVAFGWRALAIMIISIASSVLFEFLLEIILKRPVTVGDFSAVVTGMLIGMNLPSGVPLWIPVAGSAFAMILVKGVFGGLGKNFLNPAMAARAFLFMSFPSFMATYPSVLFGVEDATASATVLSKIKVGVLPEGLSIFDMFIGNMSGTIGEVSALCLIAGGIYLLIRGIIQWQIPVAYIGTVAALSFVFPRVATSRADAMLYEILAGGLMIGAIFMATDYVTSPVTKKGRLIFGIGCGALTFFFRMFSSFSEGVSFAILIMNCLVYYIDMVTKPRIFGGKQKK